MNELFQYNIGLYDPPCIHKNALVNQSIVFDVTPHQPLAKDD